MTKALPAKSHSKCQRQAERAKMFVPNIPGYSVVEMIREGGTATSWKAIQTSLKRPVIIKTFHSDGTPDDEAKVQSILGQMRKVSSLKHTGFLELIDIGVQNGVHYVVMGGSDGKSVAELLLVQPTLKEDVILRIAGDIAEAMDHAWTEKHLYHGNIKPDNIVIHPDGSTLISDLGMTRRDPVYDARTGDTYETIMGTPNYMSPEQVQGRASLDCRTDIYSLGATMYQLVTGEIPFGDAPGEETMQRHLVDCLPNPLDINPAISPALAGIIVKMMVKNPDKRYRSWNDVLTDIKRAKEKPSVAPKIDDSALSTVKPSASVAASEPAARVRQQMARPRFSQSLSDDGSDTSPADKEKKSTIQIQVQSDRPRMTRIVTSSGAGTPQERQAAKKPATTILTRMIQWLLVLGLWILLAYILLKPPVGG